MALATGSSAIPGPMLGVKQAISEFCEEPVSKLDAALTLLPWTEVPALVKLTP